MTTAPNANASTPARPPKAPFTTVQPLFGVELFLFPVLTHGEMVVAAVVSTPDTVVAASKTVAVASEKSSEKSAPSVEPSS